MIFGLNKGLGQTIKFFLQEKGGSSTLEFPCEKSVGLLYICKLPFSSLLNKSVKYQPVHFETSDEKYIISSAKDLIINPSMVAPMSNKLINFAKNDQKSFIINLGKSVTSVTYTLHYYVKDVRKQLNGNVDPNKNRCLDLPGVGLKCTFDDSFDIPLGTHKVIVNEFCKLFEIKVIDDPYSTLVPEPDNTLNPSNPDTSNPDTSNPDTSNPDISQDLTPPNPSLPAPNLKSNSGNNLNLSLYICVTMLLFCFL